MAGLCGNKHQKYNRIENLSLFLKSVEKHKRALDALKLADFDTKQRNSHCGACLSPQSSHICITLIQLQIIGFYEKPMIPF